MLRVFVRGPKTRPKHVALFYLLYIGKEIASGKHVEHTADQSAQTGEKVNWKKVKQNGGSSIGMGRLFFRLILLRKCQTLSDSSREKQFILALGM